MAAEKVGKKYPIKQINNHNNDVPIGTKDMYSAVVSPSNYVRPKNVSAMNNKCT
jgi:hypothetical protein